MRYETWIMSKKISVECENVDQAICITLMVLMSQAPVAVYNSKEKPTIVFPYDHKRVGEILDSMDIKKAYGTILINK